MATASYAWSCQATVDYFRLYESLNGGAFNLAQQVAGTQVTWNHTGIAPGNYSAQVTSVLGSTESAPSNIASFTVSAPDFSVSFTGSQVRIPQRGVGQFWVNLSSIAGFSGLLSLSAAAGSSGSTSAGMEFAPGFFAPGYFAPGYNPDRAQSSSSTPTQGVKVVLSQQSVYLSAGGSPMVSVGVSVARDATIGQFVLTVYANSGGITRSVDVLVNVSGVEMTFTATGAFAIIGIGLEPSEGTLVASQRLLDRTNGSIETDLTAIARKSYRNQAAVAGFVAGASKTAGQLTIEPTSEGISKLLIAAFGNPTSTLIAGGTGSGATATATVTGGAVTAFTVTAPGTGYSSPPSVAITGGGGTGAAGTAVLGTAGAAGTVVSITVTSPGTGYASAPTVTLSPAASFYQHVFTDGFTQGTVSLHEKRGNTFFSFGGCRCNGITATVNKTQGDPVTLMFDMMSLYEILDMPAASIALDGSVGYDVNGAFSPTNVSAIFNNVLTTAAQSLTIHPSKAVTERQVLDSFRGPNSHFVEQSNNTGNATLYFGDELALNKYFGLLEAASGARGASKSIIPVPLKLQITYNVDANGNTPGMTLFFPAAIYQRVGQPYRGPGAIMQDIAIMTQHDPATSTSFQVILQNYETAGTGAGQIAAVGTTITGVPANLQNAYHS